MSRKVLITGASRGIGREIAISFAKNKDNLVLCCKNNIEDLKALAVELTDTYGIMCKAIACDVSDYDAVKELKDAAGDVDVIVNNAGVAHIGLLTDMDIEDWKRVTGTNLDSLFYTTKLFAPGMVRAGTGRIINISSVWGEAGASCEVAEGES